MKKPQAQHKAEEATQQETSSALTNKWVPYALVGALVLLFIFLKVTRGSNPDLNTMKTKVIPNAIKKVLNAPDAKFEVTSIKEVNGMVEFGLKVNGQQYTSYMSRDGKMLFTSGIKVDDLGKQAASQAPKKALTCNDIKKAPKAKLTAFVVSQCPYGLQMQRVFKKAMAENAQLADYLDVKYIGSIENGKITAMHGDAEAQENLKQICIREEQKDLYWPYVSCYMQAGKTDECLANVGVNVSELTACTSDAKRGNKYAQADFDIANKYGVSGSPTMLSNGSQIVSEFDFGGRNADAMKQLICCASKDKPDFCGTELSKTDLAVAFSTTDEAVAGAGSTTSAAGCAPATAQ